MPDSLAPVINSAYTEVQILIATNTYQPSYTAQPVQITAIGAGATRPASGQVYPRGDK